MTEGESSIPGAPVSSHLPAEDLSVLSDEHVGTRVIRGGAQRAVGLVVANLFTAGSALILLRYLGVDAFGRYGTVLALVGVVYGISDMGLTVTGTRELALCSTPEEQRDMLGHILGLRIVVTTIGVLIAVAFATLAGYEQAEVVGTALAGFGTLLQSVQAAMLLPLGVRLRNGVLAVNQVLTQAVLLLGFGLLAAAGAGLVPFFAVQILVGVALLAATPLMLARTDFVLPHWSAQRIRTLARVGLPVAIATILGVLYLRILVIIMSLVSGRPSQVGYYVTSTRVLELVGGLPFLVVAVVLPVVTVAARDDHERLVYMTSRIAQAMALVGVLVALLLWTLAGPIIAVFGGPEYAPAAAVLQIQGFASITIFLTAAWQPALVAMHRLRALAISMITGVAAVVIAGLILIPPFQAQGAAVAAVIGDTVLCGAVYVAIRGGKTGDWLPAEGVLRIAGAAVPAVAAGLIPGLPSVVRAVLVAGVFVAVAALLRAIPSELTDALSTAVRRLPIISLR
jgi:O-antigen/teichoic acid export membrane protein